MEEVKLGDTQMSNTDLEDSAPSIPGLIAPMDGQHVLVRKIGGP